MCEEEEAILVSLFPSIQKFSSTDPQGDLFQETEWILKAP